MIDLADEIAYLTADLDDGVESGLLEIAHICENVDILARCYRIVEQRARWRGGEVSLPRGAAVDAEHTDGRSDRDDAAKYAGHRGRVA